MYSTLARFVLDLIACLLFAEEQSKVYFCSLHVAQSYLTCQEHCPFNSPVFWESA